MTRQSIMNDVVLDWPIAAAVDWPLLGFLLLLWLTGLAWLMVVLSRRWD